MKKKLIYVCCGTGIATSTILNRKVTEIVSELKVPYEIVQCTVADIPAKVASRKPDVVVSSTMISADIGSVPVVLGQSLLTGIGKEKTVSEIKELLQD
ncbi:PTS galactitol transporter subunit IIB [uncultured Lactobacillus sp.]|uniref:PTS galactitol transporter subunit IIB n=1 Tax=uncultured Lactobacillus sp. TaxID=153152 RepID=UPI0025F2C689|nr:PTS galactitol transporter subunit IIB [uncultured Lactobacillus sp.]